LATLEGVRPHLASLVDDFSRHGDQVAVVVYRGNRRCSTSYAELATLAGRFSAELAARAIGPGERVVLWGENSAEWIAAFFGCLLRGVIAVPLDLAGSAAFAARVVVDVAPRMVVGDPALLITLPESTLPGPTSLLAFSALREAMPATPLFTVDSVVTEHSPLQIIFSSGTTSEPKGIVHTHRNVLASVAPIEREMQKYLRYERFVHPLRFLHCLPLSHVFGQFMGLWVPGLLASEVHFETQLEPARLISRIHRERISVLAAVPRALELLKAYLLAKYPTLADDLAPAFGESAWRHWWRFRAIHSALGFKFWAIVCGGASLPQELEEFWNTLGFALIQGYGLTETAALVTLNHPFKIGKGTIGRPLPGREVRIGENGEILVRGEMLSTATWQRGHLVRRDQEWLNTGDMAAQDASGELRFLGRKSDVIVTPSGMNIHAADLETAVKRQPGIAACAVVPCAISQHPEPVAVVIFSGTDDQLRAAIRAANHELADYQQIRSWLRWPDLAFPYTSTGKLLRRKIAERACATLAGVAPWTQQATDSEALLGLIAAITGAVPNSATNNSVSDAMLLSEDLRLDSLGRVQLQSALEQQLGIELTDNAIEGLKTLGELRNLLRSPNPAANEVETAAGPSSTPHQPSAPSALATPPADEHIYPRWPWSAPAQMLRVLFVEAVVRPLVWLLAAPQVVTQSTDLPAGPLLIIANHVTSYDPALVIYALPPRLRRRLAIAMSGEMLVDFRKARRQQEFTLRPLGPLAYLAITALFNVFPLPRSSGFRRSFAHAGEAMDHGYSVLVFPEGHRSEDGRLHAFRPGIGLLAAQSQVPVLPVALQGLGELKSQRGGWFRSGKLSIHLGHISTLTPGNDPAGVTRELESQVRELGLKAVPANQTVQAGPA
jgi:long-chain acyl-CoA synthetase